MAYATYSDIEARWRTLSTDEQAQATTLLEDAAAMLDSLVDIDPEDETQAYLLKVVSCSMVIRSMVASASDAFGIEQLQATMGPFGQTARFTNPTGDLFLTKAEKSLLGIGGAFIGDLRAAIDGSYGSNAEGGADG